MPHGTHGSAGDGDALKAVLGLLSGADVVLEEGKRACLRGRSSFTRARDISERTKVTKIMPRLPIKSKNVLTSPKSSNCLRSSATEASY